MKTRTLLLIFMLGAFLFQACRPLSSRMEGEGMPNFLFIIADDQAYNTVHALGNPYIETPHIDRLVRNGLTFTHAFNQGSWSGAVCVVSRAMLNSGRFIYRARHDIDSVQLWGETMRNYGYVTFLTGKWHNGDHTALKSFQQAKSIGKGMFETKGGVGGPGYARPAVDKMSWQPDDTTLLGHWSPDVKDIVYADSGKVMGAPYTVHQHTSELYADNTIAFLNRHAEVSSRPFFAYVSFNAPHDPRQSPEAFLAKYPLEDIQLPDNYLPEHPFDQGQRYTLRDEILAPFPRTETVVQTHLQEYYAIITHMDQQIGRILDVLEVTGKMDNTYIIFTADHGLAVGSHGLMGKQNPYDHSIRVPLIFSGPSIPKGMQNDQLVYLQSVFPTTLDLANIPIPGHVEFQSLLPALKNEEFRGNEAIFGSYLDYQRLVRTQDYKLILYPEAGEIQLFDMENDPLEMNNLAYDPVYQDTIQALYSTLLELQQEVGDTLNLEGSLEPAL